jgi:hypothetical protein
MSSLEFSLKILIDLECVTHLIIHKEFIRDCQRYQEFGCISFSLQLLEASHDPEKNVLDSALVTMHDVSLKVRVEV